MPLRIIMSLQDLTRRYRNNRQLKEKTNLYITLAGE